jgi:hypothetical protein
VGGGGDHLNFTKAKSCKPMELPCFLKCHKSSNVSYVPIVVKNSFFWEISLKKTFARESGNLLFFPPNPLSLCSGF